MSKMDKKTYRDHFVKEFIEKHYDEVEGDLEDCIETAEIIAEHEWLKKYGYGEDEYGLC